MKKIFQIVAVLFSAASYVTAHAQVSVDNVIIHLSAGGRPVKNVNVSNNSDNKAYVLVEVKAVPDPAKDASHAVPTDELLVSPKAFSIEAHGQRTVRLLLKTPPTEKERVFRVGFIPQDRGFGQEIEKKSEGRSTVIRVLTGMGILVFADPVKPFVDLKTEREGDKVSISNLGTMHAYLGNGQSCTPSGECTVIPSKRLYSGAKYIFSTPAQNTISFSKLEGASGEFQKLTFPPKE